MNSPEIHMPVIAVAAHVSSARLTPSELPEIAYRPTQRSTPVSHIRRLEAAPEGWRICVEAVAEGFAEIIGEHAYCLNCGGVLQGAQGHDVACLTMVARRILTNEPLLHAQRLSASFPGLDIDAAHARAGAVSNDSSLVQSER